jgi:hypothetical protein
LDEEEQTVPVMDMKAATKYLNKFIFNSFPLRNKERKVACTELWTLPRIKRFPTIAKHARSLVAGKLHRPSSQLLRLVGVCIKSVFNILTDGYKWETKRASSQGLGRGYWGPEAVLCSVHAIITKLATSGGKMLARLLLLGRCPSFIPSNVHPFQGIQSVFALITTDHRCEISHGIDYLRSCISNFGLLLVCAVKILLFFVDFVELCVLLFQKTIVLGFLTYIQ